MVAFSRITERLFCGRSGSSWPLTRPNSSKRGGDPIINARKTRSNASLIGTLGYLWNRPRMTTCIRSPSPGSAMRSSSRSPRWRARGRSCSPTAPNGRNRGPSLPKPARRRACVGCWPRTRHARRSGHYAWQQHDQTHRADLAAAGAGRNSQKQPKGGWLCSMMDRAFGCGRNS